MTKNEKLKDEISEELQIMCNGQINTLITVFYDLRKKELLNKKSFIEGSDKAFINFISKIFVDNKGDPIKPAKIIKCMKDYNDDKRAKGNKRHDIEPYFLELIKQAKHP